MKAKAGLPERVRSMEGLGVAFESTTIRYERMIERDIVLTDLHLGQLEGFSVVKSSEVPLAPSAWQCLQTNVGAWSVEESLSALSGLDCSSSE